MKKESKIYVAGSNGMVGSAIVRLLQKNNFENIIITSSKELDLRNQAETESFFESEKPEYVFLAAAKVGGIIANNTYKAEFIYDNMAIALNVINSAYKFGAKKLLNLGSSCIYPKFAEQPMTEAALLTGALEPTNEPYAIAKIAAIKLCRYYNEQYGTNFISLMPTNLYGYNDNYNLETSHVLPALLRKMMLGKALMEGNSDFIHNDISKYKLGFRIDSKLQSGEITIEAALQNSGIFSNEIVLWGSGKVLREFLFTDDMAEASLYFMQNVNSTEAGEVINIGTGEDVSIFDLAHLIKNIVGYSGNLKFDSSKPDGTPRKLLDVSKASILGWQYKTNLEAGINNVLKKY